MNRREFVVRSSKALAVAALPRIPSIVEGESVPPPAAALARPQPATAFVPLRRGTGIFTGRGGTIGWLVNKDAISVADTQFPDMALICLNGLLGRESRKIDVVLNTHHHVDHTGGNPTFKPECRTIVAQDAVPKLQFEAALRAQQDPNIELWATVDQQVFADTTFPEVWRSELGDEIVTAQFLGAGHTGGDAIISFERANVVHLGDLVFNRIYPVIDPVGGGSVRGWIRVLEEAAKAYPADAIYIYGHGSAKFGATGKRADLLVQRDLLSALVEHVSREIAAGKKKEEIIGLENLPGFPDFHAPLPNRLSQNLAAVYDELTAAKT